MKILLSLAVGLLVSTSVLAAEEFNGSQPIDCTPTAGHDCLPTQQACKPLVPEKGKDLTMHVDVSKMQLKTPYRNAAMQISSFGFNTASLVMQGTASEMTWSATIHRTTGRLTMAITDREGAYVVFGQCKLATAKPAAQ